MSDMAIFHQQLPMQATASVGGESNCGLWKACTFSQEPKVTTMNSTPVSQISGASARFSHTLRATLTVIFTVLTVGLLVTTGWAASERVLHNFNDTNGNVPQAGLMVDGSGNLYGTTNAGGTYDKGTVFQLTSTDGDHWTEKVLLNFKGRDGAIPLSSLIFDARGNLYGTTMMGGGGSSCTGGCGTVFELMPEAGGGWKEQVLHRFSNNGTDGYYPESALIFDTSGNLYSTTSSGGTGGVGTVFELTPQSGFWSEKVLHPFKGGGRPFGSLVFDASGNLYGTTAFGGALADGTVYELTPKTDGGWAQTVLFGFNGADGSQPLAGLIFDASGNLYGTTSVGGTYNYGTVFELSPKAGGGWKRKLVLSFSYLDGYYPTAILTIDEAGNLYGTTYGGGSGNCQFGCGTVFELSPQAGGTWMKTLLVDFQQLTLPRGTVIFGPSGNLYGTGSNGGAYGKGTVFEVTLPVE
jgi:uncharacterized repeat protein (TIGR03803 family)